MKSTIKLTFIYFKETIMGLMGGTSKKKSRRTLPTMLLLFLLIAAALGYSLYTMGQNLKMVGAGQNILLIGFLMAVFLSLMITLNDTQGIMYRSKDYDILMSLPLSTTTIITAKYFSTYLVSLVYFSIVALPTFIVYFILQGVTVLGVLFAILSVIFMPAFSQLISCVLGWLINIIASKMRNKNFIRTLFSLITALGIALFMAFANNNMMGNLFGNGTPLWFNIIFSHIYFLFKAVTQSSFVYFISALGVSFAFIVAGIGLITLGFKRINTTLNTTKQKAKQKPIAFQKRTAFANFFKKEASTFFNSPVYCVNGVIGVIMTIVITIVTVSVYHQIKGFAGNTAIPIMAAIEVFSVAMCTGIAPTTSVSISMEGSKFQTLKALPIQYHELVLSKLCFNLVIALPITLISTIVFCSLLPVGWVLSILMIVYLILAVSSQSMLGLLFNLKYPRLHWSSETQAAKSGASMLLTMFLDIVISILPMVLFLVLMPRISSLSISIYLSVTIVVELVLTITIALLLFKRGKKLFDNIQV